MGAKPGLCSPSIDLSCRGEIIPAAQRVRPRRYLYPPAMSDTKIEYVYSLRLRDLIGERGNESRTLQFCCLCRPCSPRTPI